MQEGAEWVGRRLVREGYGVCGGRGEVGGYGGDIAELFAPSTTVSSVKRVYLSVGEWRENKICRATKEPEGSGEGSIGKLSM